MTITEKELKDYFTNVQGWTSEVVDHTPVEELLDLYEMYHEY